MTTIERRYYRLSLTEHGRQWLFVAASGAIDSCNDQDRGVVSATIEACMTEQGSLCLSEPDWRGLQNAIEAWLCHSDKPLEDRKTMLALVSKIDAMFRKPPERVEQVVIEEPKKPAKQASLFGGFE